jgi:HEAT repeat protein
MELFVPNVKKLSEKHDVEGLIKALHCYQAVFASADTLIQVRQDAATALGELRDARAVEPLIGALGEGDLELRQRATVALAAIGAPAVEPLIEALGKGNDDGLGHAEVALYQIGAPAVELLIRSLGDRNSEVRQRAFQALQYIKLDPRAGELLVKALEDDSMRSHAALLLGKIGDARAIESLIEVLLNGDPRDHRHDAALYLGTIGDARAIGPLIIALRDMDIDPRLGQYAAIALGKIKDARAVEPLIRALGNGDVYPYATSALVAIGAPAVEPLIGALGDGYFLISQCATSALIDIGAPAVAPLIGALGDENFQFRSRAVWVLRQIGRPAWPKSLANELLGAIGDALEAWKEHEEVFEGTFERIKKGMSEKEVVSLLGEPRERARGTEFFIARREREDLPMLGRSHPALPDFTYLIYNGGRVVGMLHGTVYETATHVEPY